MKKIDTLEELYVAELRDLYDAENQITKALPKVSKEAVAPELKKALDDHLEQTRGHLERLEQVFELLGEKASGKKCKGIEGILEEGKEHLEEFGETVADAGIICNAQKVEHYEMAAYGSAIAWAKELGLDDQAEVLQETLDEERAADEKLTEIAESVANAEAEDGEEKEDAA